MLKRMTVKHKMIIGGIAAVFIPFFVAGIIIYVQLSHALLEMTKEKTVATAKDISGLISASLDNEIKLASAIAADPDIIEASRTGNYRNAHIELESIYRRIGHDFFTIFLLDKKGINRLDPFYRQQVGLDLSNRDYFRKAREGETSVAGPFFARGTATPGEAIVVISVPILSEGEFLGLVGIPINTDFLVSIIQQKKLGHTGYAFLINQEGLILVHPKKEYILKLHLLDQPGTEEITKLIKGKKTGTAFFMFEGSEKIAGLASVPFTEWTVVFSQSRDEVMAPMNRILSFVSVSGLVFLMVTIIVIIFVSGRISTPIQKMMEMVKHVTKHSTEMILQIGLDRKIFFANPAAEKITGKRMEQIIGSEPEFEIPGDIPSNVIWNSLESGIPWSGRVTLRRKDMNPAVLEVMLVPFRDEHGTIQGFVEIGRDVTAEAMFEKRMQQGQKLEAIGTLAGGIAHDFNNILSGILGYAELTLMKKGAASETQEYVKEIIRASERARDLVKQIMTFSSQTTTGHRPVSLKSVLYEAVKLLRASIPATIRIVTEINSDASIMADPSQLHQVVMNLFTNAVHAIGQKSGTIALQLEDIMVDEEFTRTHPDIKPGKHVILRVSDTGSGIAPDVLDHIFEPFFTTKPPGQGTGLGLSVVHGIVKNMGGVITAYSTEGMGSIFNIIIPSIDTGDSTVEQSVASIKTGTERIAVVDDEKAITETIRSILTNLGYRVTAFSDSREALAAIKTNPHDFDIVITDYTMPVMTGLDMVRCLKEMGLAVPVILMSGYLSKEIETAAREAGIGEFIAKPVSAHELTNAIYNVVNRK